MSLMRVRTTLLSCVMLVVGATAHAQSIGYQVTSLSVFDPTLFRYTYDLTGITFLANQELQIDSPAGLYSQLTNGVASPDFDLMLFQPGNPLGFAGDYSAVAKKDSPLITTFSVDFKYLGVGLPGSQTFAINQFNQAGMFVGTLLTGATASVGSTEPAPEPGSLVLCGLIVSVGMVHRAVRRNRAVA